MLWQDPSLAFIPTDGMYAENAGAIFCQDDSRSRSFTGIQDDSRQSIRLFLRDGKINNIDDKVNNI